MAHRTIGLMKVLENADKQSKSCNLTYTSTIEIVYAMLTTPKCFAQNYLNAFNVTKENFYTYIRGSLDYNLPSGLTIEAKSCLFNAEKVAIRYGFNYISSEHLLLAILLTEDTRVSGVFRALGTNVDGLIKFIEKKIIERNEEENGIEKPNSLQKPQNNKSIDNPLKGLGYSLTEKALKGQLDVVIGRDKEIDGIIQTLARKTKNSPLLIGEAGVGKSAIVEGLAIKIAKGNVPDTLKNKNIFSLDISGLVSGTKYRGEFEKKLKNAIDYVLEKKDIIFFIDEVHNIVGAGRSSDSSLDIAEIFKPLLSRGEITVIGATTINEYRKYIEKDGALSRRFQTIMVSEPSIEDAIVILKGLRQIFEAHHKVRITDEAIESAVKLSNRYITDRRLPDKAIDLIDEACSKKKIFAKKEPTTIIKLKEEYDKLVANCEYCMHHNDLDGAKAYDSKASQVLAKLEKEKNKFNEKRIKTENVVTDEDIKELLSIWTNIPLTTLTETESQKFAHLEDELFKRIVGQEHAVISLAKAVRRSIAGLKDPDKPIGSFLFVGPTGVGKSQLSKAVSECVFNSQNALIRFDMSEYSDKTSVNKLIGSAPGYVGYEEEGLLTEKIRRNPYSVVLFDEIEKAHSDIFDLLLQVLDEGRLTDSKGRVVSFKNAIIILTSNVGYQNTQTKTMGFGEQNSQKSIKENLKGVFRPEFLNRLDEIIVFNKLTLNDCYDIADILVNSLIKRMRDEGYLLTIENSAMDIIVKNGYDEDNGARPLKREIANNIEDLLSDAIIEGSIKKGDKVIVYGEDNEIKFKVI